MALVLLTGGSGFIGATTLRYALEKGYRVRATARSQSKADALSKRMNKYSDKLETVVVPDILADGAYDEAIKGVEYVVHLASPLAIGTLDDDLDALIIQPAVQGTLEILRASAKEDSVKRVVITSSTVALTPFFAMIGKEPSGDKVFGAADRAPDIKPPYPAVFAAYTQSKIASLRAAEEWMKRQQPKFDLTTIHPSFVGGRSEIAETAKDLLTGTNPFFLAPALGAEAVAQTGSQMANAVDVEDVAKAHIQALNESVPGNQAFLLTNQGGEFAWNDVKKVRHR
jgi:nucleoside-diphosphate-sugar epimerase